jgi:hypothetical protein
MGKQVRHRRFAHLGAWFVNPAPESLAAFGQIICTGSTAPLLAASDRYGVVAQTAHLQIPLQILGNAIGTNPDDNMNPNAILIIVASTAAVVTFTVARAVLRRHAFLKPPTAVAALVAGLGFLGLLACGSAIAVLILLPFAALALTVLIMFLWTNFAKWSQHSRGLERRQSAERPKPSTPGRTNRWPQTTPFILKHNSTNAKP